jgi:hypothetical protein
MSTAEDAAKDTAIETGRIAYKRRRTGQHVIAPGPAHYVEVVLPDEGGLTILEWKRLCVQLLMLCDEHNPGDQPPQLSLSIPR